MSDQLSAHALREVAQKWRLLAERRREHFLDLYQSGRWQRYYRDEGQFLRRLHEAIRLTERWAEIAPPLVLGVTEHQSPTDTGHRSAA